jgi:hypothetical protein
VPTQNLPLKHNVGSRVGGAGGRLVRRLLAVGLAVCLVVLVLETGYRVRQALTYGTPVWQGVDDLGRDRALEDRLNPIALDPRLGWRSASNYRFDGVRRNLDGSSYPVHVTFQPDGFRAFGDPNIRRPKVLFIGDSYTQAVSVSDDATYYAVLRRDLDVEIFAYGGGGFGTLQEEMLLDQTFDAIKPDVVVWQYCSNDFVNNSLELESASYLNNNHLVRPYLEGDTVIYELPAADPLGLRTFWGMHSRVTYALLTRWDALEADRHATDSVEVTIERLGLQHPGFQRAVDTTRRLMSMVVARAGGRPVVAFSCDENEPYTSALQMVSSASGVEFWPDVAQAVDAADAAGQSVRGTDFHWNPLGHRIVAEVLGPHVRAAVRARGL